MSASYSYYDFGFVLSSLFVIAMKQEYAARDGNKLVQSDDSGNPPPVPSFAHVDFDQFDQRYMDKPSVYELLNDLETRLVARMVQIEDRMDRIENEWAASKKAAAVAAGNDDAATAAEEEVAYITPRRGVWQWVGIALMIVSISVGSLFFHYHYGIGLEQILVFVTMLSFVHYLLGGVSPVINILVALWIANQYDLLPDWNL